MSFTPFRKRVGKKLLVATVGLATLTIAACDDTTTSGNLIAPPDLGAEMSSGNLLPPPDMGPEDASTPTDAGTPSDAGSPTDAGTPTDATSLGVDFSVGNLLPPPDFGTM